MLAYILCAGLWLGIIFGWLIPVVRKRMFYEVYASLGVGIMLSMVLCLIFKWGWGGIAWLRYAGFALYAPAAAFVILAFVTLAHKGKPESGWEETTRIIETGVFGIVRHPLFLGSAIWSFALILVIQLILSIILGLASVFFLWMASRGEEAFNLRKFGDEYRKYMDRVPRWNFIKGLYRLVVQRTKPG